MRKAIKKLIILLLIFIGAVGVMMWTGRDSESVKTYTDMEPAGLPVIDLIYGDRAINELHGYTLELKTGTVRETIYPLGEDRVIPLRIATFGNRVTAVGYEVRSLDGSRLIEENRTEQLSESGQDMLTAKIVLMDLLDKDEEYLVTFTLYDEERKEASYYTRVRIADGEILSGAVDFALDFSDKTFLDEPDEMLIAQLESRPGADNSNLGYTDIHSSYSQVLWGNLHPRRVGETKVSVCEFDRLMTSVKLSYRIMSEGGSGETEYYDVEEFFAVRYVNGKYYLMTYERTANQLFLTNDTVEKDGSLLLGVVSADQLPLGICHNGNYTAFVRDGSLRCYDQSEDCLRTLFSFNGGEDDIRTGYDQHDLRIVRMKDNGDVEFLVYGYMNRGRHEGECGIAYYRYLMSEDALEEVFYIASDRNYQRLKEELGTLSYMSQSGLFYLMYDRTVYAVDVDSGEYVELASGLRSGGLSVDEQDGIAAWQEDDPETGKARIILYYLETGESRTISAASGEQVEMIGFIDGDLLYGLVRDSDLAQTSAYSSVRPIHALEIVNTQGEVVTHYVQEGVWLTDIKIMGDRICFGRKRRENNVWEQLEDDVLFCSEDTEQKEEEILKTEKSDRLKQIYKLDLHLTESTSVIRKNPKFLDTEPVRLVLNRSAEKSGERFYAYSFGRLQGIFDQVSDAIACIEADMGVVVDENQEMIWNRGNRSAAALVSLPKTEPVNDPQVSDYLNLFLTKLGTDADCRVEGGKNIFSLLQSCSDRKLLNLENCTLSQILYYLYEGVPVLGMNGRDEAVLLVGYEEAYGSVTLRYYDLITAETKEADSKEAEQWFSSSGNRFISAVP